MNTIQSASQSTLIALASVCANLVNRQFQFSLTEELLVIEAIRRSSNKLSAATYEELGEHIGNMNEQSLMGFGNNIKGIYHELLYVHTENNDGDEITAEVFGSTNYPGADVRIKENGEVIEELQLKATDNPNLVQRHIDRYPDIPVAATDEAASQMDGVVSSGFTDTELESRVSSTLEDLANDNPVSNAEDVAGTSGLLSAALQAREVINGKKSLHEASGQTLQDMGIAVTSSFLVDLMFST
jgi:hypothetical protein